MFRDKTKLTDHERTHTKEKPHKCDVCEMAFASRDGLCKFKRAFRHFALLIDANSDS